jgi:hypothetical protein
MCEPFKSHGELAMENPGGLEALGSVSNFSSNPGFAPVMGTGVARPTGGPAKPMGGMSNMGGLGPPRAPGGPAIGHPGGTAMSSPRERSPIGLTSPIGTPSGATDGGMDGGPLVVTTGFGG